MFYQFISSEGESMQSSGHKWWAIYMLDTWNDISLVTFEGLPWTDRKGKKCFRAKTIIATNWNWFGLKCIFYSVLMLTTEKKMKNVHNSVHGISCHCRFCSFCRFSLFISLKQHLIIFCLFYNNDLWEKISFLFCGVFQTDHNLIYCLLSLCTAQ